MPDEDRKDHFRRHLESLKEQVQHYLSVARDDTVAWKQRLEAANEAREAYEEWRKVNSKAMEEGYRIIDAERPVEPYHGLHDTILGERKGQVGLEINPALLSPSVACEHGRELERRRTDLLGEGNEKKAEQAIEEAKRVYWSLIESDFIGTFPYKRLCIIYRSRDQHPSKEKEVARRALKEADVSTEKQREWFENRVERAEEIQSE